MSNKAKFKKKVNYFKQQRVKEKKHLDVESSGSTHADSKSKRMKSKRENLKCDYFKVPNHEKYCFKSSMDIMTKLLENNNIDVPYFARREERELSLEQEGGKCLCDLSSRFKNISNI